MDIYTVYKVSRTMSTRNSTPLAKALDEDGRRQDWLARQLGVDRFQMSRWVRGVHVPVEPTRVEIARVLGRTVDELFPDEAEPPASEPEDLVA